MGAHCWGVDGFVKRKNSGEEGVVGRHDLSFEDATFVTALVPPDPVPALSLITATKEESAGYLRTNEYAFPDWMVWSRITLASGSTWPVGTRSSLYGAFPLVHWTVILAHCVGIPVNQNEKAFASGTARSSIMLFCNMILMARSELEMKGIV
jgi:hypothetical protein